jgi:hypothetical protein
MLISLGLCFLLAFITKRTRQKLETKKQEEVLKKGLEEGTINEEELKKQAERDKPPQDSEKKKNSSRIPFYDISPFLSFLLCCVVAPLGEECIFRYLIFEIFDKDNPLAYIFSAAGFILLHWLGPLGGLFNFTTIGLLLLTYLPLTVALIFVYRKSK